MSAPVRSIREVVIAGGGIVGWSAAAALRKRLPALNVSVLALPPPPNARFLTRFRFHARLRESCVTHW